MTFLGAAPPELDPAAYERLARDVRTLLGIDLAQYKPAQVWRRVNGFARSNGLADVAALTAAARADRALRDRFRDMLTINVSEFLRNPEAWARLDELVLSGTLARGRGLRAWSAGCSIGFEPYTLAMLARERSASGLVRILATDIDAVALDRAKSARYTEPQMAGISPVRRDRFFVPSGDAWEVRPEIRALVTFRRHDLLRDPFESAFDLVVCRNTVIYFTEEAKAQLFRRLAASVRPGGALFIGATEAIASPREIGLAPLAPSLFTRIGA